MMRIVLFIFYALIPAFTYSQQLLQQDTAKRESVIQQHADDNTITFSAVTPPLQQIPGAPKAFYEYHWEFGDGEYSTEKEPVHTYKKEGEYTVRLWTTNNYDNGKPPPSRPQKVQIKKITYEYTPPAPIADPVGFDLKNNREPVPEEEMVVIMTYRNDTGYPTDGKLYLFFNEEKFKADNFSLLEARTHHGERTVPDMPVAVAGMFALHPYSMWAANGLNQYLSTNTTTTDKTLLEELEQARQAFRNSHVLEFDAMAPGESRHVFYSLQTTPEMLKDTSAVIKVKGIYVPDRKGSHYQQKELEMEIVTSHDPNKMSVSDTRLNYRTYRNKTMDFKIRFQNNGEGPATSIKLLVDVSAMYDKHSLKLGDVYPPCPVCPDGQEVTYGCIDTLFTKDKITFHFKNIYLPGSNQKNVEAYDSTKGYVKYSLRFNPSIDKQRTVSRTAIIFDKNEPVITNYAATRFKPGMSIGARAGYTMFSSLAESKSFFAGVTLSPYKSYRGYFQVELYGTYQKYADEDSTHRETLTPIDGLQGFYDLYETSQRSQYSNLLLTAVPVSYRYALNRYIGIGAGVQVTTNLSGKITNEGTERYYLYIAPEDMRQRDSKRDRTISTEERTSRFSDFNAGLFADLTIGSARIGPTLGARYIYHLDDPHNQYQFYAQWKF